MRIKNKFRKLIILVALAVGLFFTVYGISSKLRTNAASNPSYPVVTFEYKAYKKDGWDAYNSAVIFDNSCSDQSGNTVASIKTILANYEKLPTGPKNNYFTTGFGAKFKTYYNYKKKADGTYDPMDTEDGWTEHSRGSTSAEVYNSLKAEVAAIEANFASAAVTKMVPGQEIVIAAYATTSTGDALASIAVELGGIKDMIAPSTTPSFYNDTTATPGYKVANKVESTGDILLGIGYDDTTALPYPTFVGAVAFEVSPAAANTSIGMVTSGAYQAQTLMRDVNNVTGINRLNYPDNFAETPLELNGAAVSPNTDLETLTVEGTDALQGNYSGPTYVGSEISDGEANVRVSVKESGTIATTAYIHESQPNLSSPTSSKQVSITAGNLSYDMSGVDTGKSVWLAFQAVASDGTTKKWYSVELPKAKAKDATLESVDISCTNGGSSVTILSKNGTELQNTTNFDVYYPSSADSGGFTINPSVTSPKKVKIGSTEVNGSTPITVTDGGTVTVTVVAQDTGVTKDYVFTFHATSTAPESVVGTSGQPVKTVTATYNGTNYDATTSTFKLPAMAAGRESFDLKINFPSSFPSSATVTLTGVESSAKTLTVSGGVATVVGVTYGAGFTGDNARLAATKTMTLTVTAGGATSTYTIVVERPEVLADGDIVIQNAYYQTDSGTISISIPTNTGATHAATPKLPYNTAKVYFTITMSNPSSKTEIISVSSSDTSAANTDIRGVAQTFSLPTGPTNLSQQYQFYVKTEFDALKNSNGTLHTITFTEENPDSTKTFNKMDVIGSTSGSAITPTQSGDTYTYALDPTTDGTQFTVDMDWNDPTKTKAYIGTTANPTTPYDPSNKPTYTVGDTVYVKLVAEDGSSVTRVIKSETKKSDDNGIVSVKIEDVPTTGTANTLIDTPITASKTTYAYPDIQKVSYGTKKVKVTVVLSNSKAGLTIGGVTTTTGSTTRTAELNVTQTFNNYDVICTAENGKVGTKYTFKVERELPLEDSYIESLSIGGIDCTVANTTYFKNEFNKNVGTFDMYLPCTYTNGSVVFTVSNKASYIVNISGSSTPITGEYPNSGSFQFANPIADKTVYTFTITVKSEKDRIDNTTTANGTHQYTFNIYVGDQTHDLDNLELVTTTGGVLSDTSGISLDITNYTNYGSSSQAFEVPYETEKIKISTTDKTGFHGTVTYDGGTNPEISLTAGQTQKITVKVTSELTGLSSTKFGDLVTNYVFYVKRKDCTHDKTLKSLDVSIDGTAQTITFSPTTFTYNIENLASGSQITINGVPNDDNSKVIDGNGTFNITGLDYADTTKQTTETFKIHVACQCAAKGTQEYSITLSTKPVVKSNDPGSLTLTAGTELGTAIGPSATVQFNPATLTYSIKLTNTETPNADDHVDFTITKTEKTASLYYNDGGTDQATKDTTATYTVDNIALGGSKTVKVWLVAEDGTTKGKEYTINITRAAAASTDNELTDLKCNNTTVTGFSQSNGGPYKVNIGNLDYAYFTVTTSDGKATVSNEFNSYANRYTFTATEFTHSFAIVVTAENKATKTYTVEVTRDDKTILNKLDAKVGGVSKLKPNWSDTITEYTVQLGLKDTAVDLEFTPNNLNTTVKLFDSSNNQVSYTGNSYTVNVPNPTVDAAGTDTPLVYTFAVIAASGAQTEYKVKISKERGSDEVFIKSFKYLQQTGSPMETLSITTGQYKYEYRVDRDITTFNPDTNGNVVIELNDPNATYNVTSSRNLIAGQKNTINVEAIPASGDTTKKKLYTFDVYPCDDEFTLDDIRALVSDQSANLLDVDKVKYIDYKNNVLSITVPHGTSNILDTYLKVTSSADNYKVYLNGSEMTNPIQHLIEGTNTFKIQIVSDYAAAYQTATGTKLSTYCSPEITVTIVRKALSTDATLKTLTVSYIDDQGNPQTKKFDGLPNNSTFTLPYLGDNVKNVTIAATPNDSAAKVSGTGNKSLTDGTPDASGNFNFTVTCTAEDGVTSLDYPIAIARGKIDLNKDNTIDEIIVEDSDGNTYLAGSDFDPKTESYGTFKIPFKSQSYIISVKKPDGTYSKTWIDGKNVESLTTPITSAMRGTTKDVKVYAVAQDATAGKGTEYTIKLEFEAPSTDSSLSSLKADGTTVPGFKPEITEYELSTRPNSTETIKIEYETTDSKAKVTGDTGVQKLTEGDNTFSVVVTAEDGTSTTYKIKVKRDYPLPYLTDLAVSGEKLLDSNYKKTDFAKEEYNYTVIVSYMTLHATINAAVDNKDFTVTCSNSTVNTTADLLRTFNVDLVEGLNKFAITVTSPENKTVTYNLTIKRRGEASTNTDIGDIDIKEDPDFKDEYNNETREYDLVVPNGIRNLNINVRPEKGPDADGDGATVRIINDKNLRVGKNTVVILVTAEDGETTRAVLINVTRLPMKFTVDTKAYEKFPCEKQDGADNRYTIKLGDKLASDISDYTKYIVFSDEDYDPKDENVILPEVTVVSDTSNKNCSEVIVRIYDGDKEEFVSFQLESSAIGGGGISNLLQIIIPWILLAIAIIILILILICVNRDKYGAINKKRKKDEE